MSDKIKVACDCDGGYWERIVGEDRSGMGGISPITRTERRNPIVSSYARL